MRLLRTDRIELKSFSDSDLSETRYAILSHCWSKNASDEVTFDDVQQGTAERKKAFHKVRDSMRQAKADGYEWIWIDTCCIDKSSSSELTEAINSMFSWYQQAALCYAYIEENHIFSSAELELAVWFTRAWTLQELISPKELVFFNRKWDRIGSKRDTSICSLISKVTRIDAGVLTGALPLSSVSIAKRMSWAAHRQATRQEDIAYSLMGVFGVNMPMLYGEGAVKAFHRLQEQIMKDSNDHSIFAWRSADESDDTRGHGLLADSPRDFSGASDIIAYNDWEDSSPFQLSNRGLRIELYLTDLKDGTYAGALNCPIPSPDEGYHGFIAVRLKKLPIGVNQYARVACHEIVGLTQRGDMSVVYVRQNAMIEEHMAVLPWHFFSLRNLYPSDKSYELMGIAHFYPVGNDEKQFAPGPSQETNSWVARGNRTAFQVVKKGGRVSAALSFRSISDGAEFVILLGCYTDLEVGFDVQEYSYSDLERLQPHFRPKRPGQWIEVGSHRICVNVEHRVDVPRKVYLVDINIMSNVGINMMPPAYDPYIPNSSDFTIGVVDFLVERTRSQRVQGHAESRYH